jgi:hypothetical protein
MQDTSEQLFIIGRTSCEFNRFQVSKSRAPAILTPFRKAIHLWVANFAHLLKDGRKQIKSSDGDHTAMRVTKKQARNALAKEGVKVQIRDREYGKIWLSEAGRISWLRPPTMTSNGFRCETWKSQKLIISTQQPSLVR